MLEREEKTAIILLTLTLLGVSIGYGIINYLGNPTFAVPYIPSSPEGQLVVFDATIDRVTITSGGHIILDCGNVTVFIPSTAAGDFVLQKGDHVRIYGVVQVYKGEKEILLKSREDISRIS